MRDVERWLSTVNVSSRNYVVVSVREAITGTAAGMSAAVPPVSSADILAAHHGCPVDSAVMTGAA